MPLPEGLPAVTVADSISLPVDGEALAAVSAKMGLAALAGEKGLMRSALIYSASIAMTHLKRVETMSEAAEQVRVALDNGLALEVFNAAKRR